jgi:hypothetical protein
MSSHGDKLSGSFLLGGSYFFTVNLADRRRGLLVENIGLLRASFRSLRPAYFPAPSGKMGRAASKPHRIASGRRAGYQDTE